MNCSVVLKHINTPMNRLIGMPEKYLPSALDIFSAASVVRLSYSCSIMFRTHVNQETKISYNAFCSTVNQLCEIQCKYPVSPSSGYSFSYTINRHIN